MTRYVIGPDVAIRLAHGRAVIRGELTRRDAEAQLSHVHELPIRLLDDLVLHNVAWKAAGQLGWPDTFAAEYVALAQLHADALITLDRHLAGAVHDLVTIAPIEALYSPEQTVRTA